MLTIVGDQKEKIEAFNAMFTNIKSIGYFIQRKMSAATDILEYRAWRDLYNAMFILIHFQGSSIISANVSAFFASSKLNANVSQGVYPSASSVIYPMTSRIVEWMTKGR